MKTREFLFMAFVLVSCHEPKEEKQSDNEERMHPAEAAYTNFNQSKKAIQEQFRKDLSKIFEEAEHAEVLLLDFEMVEELPTGGEVVSSQISGIEELKADADTKELTNSSDIDEELKKWISDGEIEASEYFQILPYGTFSKILESKTLDAKSMEILKKGVVRLLNQPDQDSSAWCHYPIHAIRLADKNRDVMFQTSVCYVCGNYFLAYPDEYQEPSWIDFTDE